MSLEQKNTKITMLIPKKNALDIEPQQLVGEILHIYNVCVYIYIYITIYPTNLLDCTPKYEVG